jgi:hypothetical protein
VGQKIRLLAHRTEQVQSDHATACHQAGQQPLRLLDGRRTGRCLRTAYASFNEGGRGRRQLRPTREIQAQRMLFQPSLCVFEGEEGILLLAPVRRSCCLELLCCQVDSALSKLGRVSLQHFRKNVDRDRSRRSLPPKKAARNHRSTVHSITKML